MPKHTVQIDVPDGWRIAAYRSPLEGEWYLEDGDVVQAMADFTGHRIVLCADWRWPAWLKAGWVAMNEDGDWMAYNAPPWIDCDELFWTCHKDSSIMWLHPDYFRFDPPPYDDWTSSLRQNPAYMRGAV